MRKHLLLWSAVLISLGPVYGRGGAGDEYLRAAVQAANWIEALKFSGSDCHIWAPDESLASLGTPALYNGSSGIVLFYLELYHATHARRYLSEAEMGTRFLCRDFANYAFYERMGYAHETLFSLYSGNVAGTALALTEVYKATKKPIYREEALKFIAYLQRTLSKHEGEKEWFGVHDIISGSAGIGLFMLYAYREFQRPEFLATANKLGEMLLAAALPVQDGLRWPASDADGKAGRYMPNFSHGTAGISYFLARLYEVNGDERFLRAALAGARHLEGIADSECLVYHDEPDGKECFYLGWCHGPAGTGRLYYLLWKLSRDDKWLEKIKKSARAVMASGIPEKQTTGFWNNVGMCCGSAGLALYFLNLYDVLGDGEYLNFARRLAADLLQKASAAGQGIKWPQAEYRRYPDYLVAQTGYMQGAAGIGICLLHLSDFAKKRKPFIILPDSPFAY